MTHVVHQSISQFTRVALCGLLLAALASLGYAQTQTPAATQVAYQVNIVKIKSGLNNEYQEFRKSERLPALRKGGVKEQAFWTTATFGQSGEHLIATRTESLAQFDEPSPINKALGAEGARAHNTKLVRFIESSRTLIIFLRPELSSAPKAGTALKMAVHTTIRIAPGHTAEYESFIKNDALPLYKKAGVKGVLVYKVVLGGDANEYHSLLLVDSFAEAQKITQALSQEGAGKLEPKTAGIVTHRETAMIRYVPELSIAPEPQKAAQ